MFEAIILGYRWFFLQLAGMVGYGWGIVALSVITSAAMMPLMKAVAGVVRRETEYQGVILPQIAEINRRYGSDIERNLHIQRLYARYGYSPLSAVKKVLPLFVQIPFLLLTYFMLKDTAQLAGVSFLFLRDLGLPDALAHGLNLLPLAMTGVNLITVAATPGFTNRDRIQAIAIALLFLVMLYTAPSALLLYWTLNNAITMVRTLVAKRGEGAKLLTARVKLLLSQIEPQAAIGVLIRALPKAARNILILELCLFLPGIAAIFATMPDRLDVDVYSEVPMSIAAGFELEDDAGSTHMVGEVKQGCPIGKHDDPVSFYFADGFPAESFRLKFSGSDLAYKLNSVRLAKRQVVFYDYPVALEGHVARLVGKPKFSGLKIPEVKFSYAAIYASQMFILLLALAGCFLEKQRDGKPMWKQSLLLAVGCALFIAVVLPGETIAMNRDVMDFPLFEIGTQMSCSFAALAIMVFCILQLSSIGFGWLFHYVLLGVLVYEYLQTGVLSIGTPTLDGNMDYYWERTPLLIDGACITLVGAIFLLGRKFIVRQITTLMVALLILYGVNLSISLLAADKPRTYTQSSDCPWNMRREEVAKNITYSPVRNVIVLVLDSVQSDAAFDIIQKDDKLRAAFDGFTAFNNHLGMHDNTHSGSIGIFTGKYHDKGMEVATLAKECYGDDSFVALYQKDDCPIFLMPGILGAYSNRITKHVPPRKQLIADSIYYRRVKPMNISLVDVIRLRAVPFLLKKWVLQITYLTCYGSDGTWEENSLLPELAQNEIADEQNKALIYIHTEGTHAPIRYDEYGNRLWANKDNYRGLCGETHYILKSVGAYLRELKKRGIYDKSLIVLTADHGCCFDTVHSRMLANAPTRAVPMLWIKPVGVSGELAICEEPTSHVKLVDLMKRVKDDDLPMAGIVDTLRTETRLFREGRTDATFKDWRFDAQGNVILQEK